MVTVLFWLILAVMTGGVIAALIVPSAIAIVRRSTHILLEGTPAEVYTAALGADFMERWYHTQCARTLETPRHLPEAAASTPPPPTADPWERAIAQARAEIRALIESGDLLGPADQIALLAASIERDQADRRANPKSWRWSA